MSATTTSTAASPSAPVVAIRNLTITYHARQRSIQAVRGVNLTVRQGQTVAIVGESGSGKSSVIHAILGILPPSAQVDGTILVGDTDISHASEGQRQAVRTELIGYVPQDPQSSLDPTMRIGAQVAEVVRLKEKANAQDAAQRAQELLRQAGIANAQLRAHQYPHELSGGLKQRVLIAMALAGNPQLLVADEPTSALDVTVQRTILDHIERLVHKLGISLLMVTHDLAVASDRADRIVVMNRGVVVEENDTAQIIDHPHDRYTRTLLETAPSFEALHGNAANAANAGEAASDVDDIASDAAVQWASISKTFVTKTTEGQRLFHALDDVSLVARRGKTLAIVGESGSGKSTLLRIALGLIRPTDGTIIVNGINLGKIGTKELRKARRGFQLVQQNPFESFDPRMSIAESIAEPLKAFREGNRQTRAKRVHELLDLVALPQSLAQAKPKELSGGQCQRAAIARALALGPETLMLDEPVSALDVTVQDQIMKLLIRIQNELNLSYVFVSHDLAVVEMIAHDVAVLRSGKVIEHGTTGQILSHPSTEYTKELIESIPGNHRAESTGRHDINIAP